MTDKPSDSSLTPYPAGEPQVLLLILWRPRSGGERHEELEHLVELLLQRLKATLYVSIQAVQTMVQRIQAPIDRFQVLDHSFDIPPLTADDPNIIVVFSSTSRM